MAGVLLGRVGRARPRRRRQFGNRVLLVDVSDNTIISNYRLNRQLIVELIDGFADSDFSNKTHRSNALLPETQVLVALRFFAKSGFLSEIAQLHGVSKSTVSRCVDSVASYLCSIVNQHIHYPDDPAQIASISQGFYALAGFPRVLGCVDGTHIPIKAPSVQEHAYVYRKNEHSINAMAICDANLIIRDFEVKWPGSSHDSFIFNMSEIHDDLENGRFRGYWLLGDSAYACRNFLLTPLLHPQTDAETRYNTSHKRTRVTIERCFGVLKSRFRCLHKTGGIMELLPPTTCKVVVACAILHNMAIEHRLPPPEDAEESDEEDEPDRREGHIQDGIAARANLIAQRFN